MLRTLFGTLHLPSPRYKSCPCTAAEAATVSSLARLLPERTTPELLFWEAKYAALTSYGTAATLLTETFPLGRDLETMPRPDLPLVVGLDGGYAHSSQQTSRRDGWFEVVTGRSTPSGGRPGKCFAFVQTYDTKPKRRLHETLRAQGLQDNQQVTFFTDGGEDIRDLPRYLNPQAEHYLDWFHITMRLTVLRQMTRSLPEPPPEQDEEFPVPAGVAPGAADATLDRIKHFLWHGNTFRAPDLLSDLVADFECLAEPAQRQQAFLARLAEFRGYIANNANKIPNYGERRRNGDVVSSAMAEATVNLVVSRRMVKKQQMRWSPRGAHLLLQLQTRVLNRDLAADFGRWYPGFTTSDQPAAAAA
ncbi:MULTISPECIES: ISKra4 family transposase [unclassified Crossiella]|uniref:ISKra4 family transposase n=1 Tax=unclassified Crossiella TaxID=2620835 RepID=UPI001FFF90BF|nr:MULTISPECIES: ISKra4 family transposase [unclassified Crossiella]MCK2238977.1 ISKra4 family transposase [Crossiella sp. S99.2]MCK2251454.1 ISKra4 family transposase [Crossiella sp. S99.1]